MQKTMAKSTQRRRRCLEKRERLEEYLDGNDRDLPCLATDSREYRMFLHETEPSAAHQTDLARR